MLNSLPAHKDEVETLLKDQGIHILALNETKVDDNIPRDLLPIDGYRFVRHDRNRDGGGVGFYISNTIVADVREDLPYFSLEARCIEDKPVKAKSFFVVTWYRPPSDHVDTFDRLDQFVRVLDAEDKEIILLGDTNCNVGAPQDDHDIPPCTKRIVEFYDTFGLQQLISEPTRETASSSTIIDHIATNDPRNVVESGVQQTCISDHYVVYVVRKYFGSLKPQHKMITTRQMKNFDEELFLGDLASVDWRSIVSDSGSLDDAVSRWSDTLSQIIDKHAPLREKRVSERFCPWITPDLKKICRARDKLKIAAVKANSELLMTAYKHMRCKANNLNQSLKTQYFTNKLRSCEGNIKETWKTMNQVINKRSKTTNINALQEGDETITDNKSIADTMNSFFCNVGKSLAEKIAPKPNPLLNGEFGDPPSCEPFMFSPINEETLIRVCSGIQMCRVLIVYLVFLKNWYFCIGTISRAAVQLISFSRAIP